MYMYHFFFASHLAPRSHTSTIHEVAYGKYKLSQSLHGSVLCSIVAQCVLLMFTRFWNCYNKMLKYLVVLNRRLRACVLPLAVGSVSAPSIAFHMYWYIHVSTTIYMYMSSFSACRWCASSAIKFSPTNRRLCSTCAPCTSWGNPWGARTAAKTTSSHARRILFTRKNAGRKTSSLEFARIQ